MAIRFNGLDLPSFVLVNDIHVSLLPPIKQMTQTISGRAGSYDFGNQLGERKITVDITIEASTSSELRSHLRELATWLYYEEAKQLILLDEPDKYYLAKVTDEIEIKQNISVGQGSLTFWCSDPFAYSTTKIQVPFAPTDTNPISLINNSNINVYPQMEVTFSGNTTDFALITEDEYLYFGQPAPVDSTTPTSKRTLAFQDVCSTTTGWSSGISVDGGLIAGSLSSNGSLINGSYGSGSAWHGPAGVKALGQAIQDFTLEFFLNFKMTASNQIGRVELYLLDINNAVIAKLAMVDSTVSSNIGRVEARLGNAATGKYLISSEIGKGYYTNFYGRLYLQRIGQKYLFSIGKIDAKGNYFGRWSTAYYDTSNTFQSKLAGIQIHLGQYASYPVIPTLTINEIRVWNESTLTPVQIPYVFVSGDTLFIDSATGTILKNGEPAFDTLGDLGIDFIQLKPGITNLSVTQPIVSSGTITYQERWL